MSQTFDVTDFELRCSGCDVRNPPQANYCCQCGEPIGESGEAVNISDELLDSMGLVEVGRGGRLIPFSYYGGKYKHLNWLLPLLPRKKAYVEPFGGSGTVLLNREQSDCETFNDIHSEVINFFRVLRNQTDELLFEVSLSPYSEEAFELSVDRDGNISDLEQARRFFVAINQSYNGDINSPYWSTNTAYSSRGVTKKVSNYQAKLQRLVPIARRLADVQICNRPAVDCIEKFDTEDGLIYNDPPYPPGTRGTGDKYIHEMSEDDHRELATTLRAADADVAVSSYASELYDEIFIEEGEFERIDAEGRKSTASHGDKVDRVESLYVNYTVTDEMMTEAFE